MDYTSDKVVNFKEKFENTVKKNIFKEMVLKIFLLF